ncbi:hypothetical protein RSAG8_03954, partial [Rhizoctonia solani AG-8 WAC10335]
MQDLQRLLGRRSHEQLYNLAETHQARYLQLKEVNDIDRAIEYGTYALDLIPDGHPDLPLRLSGLGISCFLRFQRLGELDDIQKSIQYETRALDLTPEGHPDMPSRLASQRLGELDDIEKSIQYHTRALDLTPEGHPDMPSRLASLGSSYYNRFQHLGELDDIQKSIQYNTRALDLTPQGHPHMPSRLASLGSSYYTRFQHLGELDDIQKSIQYETRALDLTPEGHPHLPLRHQSLAHTQFTQFQRTGNHSHLQHSLELFHKASQSLTGAPRDKFQNALQWATLASTHVVLDPIEAYQTTIDLLPQFIWLGATTNQRYEDLLKVGNLATKAASAAILSSEYELALTWLEYARCVVWNQSLMLRSPLDQLQVSHPDIAAHLQQVAAQLHTTSSESRTSQAISSGSLTPEQIGQKHRHLAKEYTDLLEQTQKLSGFEEFLKPPKVAGLIGAARNGPIVMINCHTSCHALLIIPGQDQVHSIDLPNFSLKEIQYTRSHMQKLLKRTGFRERGAQLDCDLEEESFEDLLKLLWNDLVKPVLDFLGYMRESSSGNLPHITWCPTGAVSFLPLHAAGDYDQPHSRVFDYVVSSYTPTLTVLLSSFPRSLGPGSRVLGVGQEVTSTPGYRLSKLPGTTKDLNLMKQHTERMHNVSFSELKDQKATKSAVLDAMEQHDWVHLACHAHQNVGSATESGFFLHDGILDLASINRRSLKNKGLAFLSACQTATGDAKLPDEAVHLASGMLMAGYSSVIATMWSVVDDDAPFVADKVYGQLMQDGKVGNGEAGRALHGAVGALREKVGEREFGRWVPYIHIGS